MVWLIVSIAITGTVCLSIWCGLAMAEMVYGYPLGRHLMRKMIGRLDEFAFLPSDIEELNATFTRVAGTYIVTD